MSDHTEKHDESEHGHHHETKRVKSNTTLIISIVVGVAVIAGAFIVSGLRSDKASVNANKPFTIQELSQANGKNGQPCYVAVDGKVYEIKQGKKWKDGEHTTSNGEMECGVDGTEIIKNSPHGKSILSVLTQVGTLSQ